MIVRWWDDRSGEQHEVHANYVEVHPDGTVEIYGDGHGVQRIEPGDTKGRILIVREPNGELEQQLRESDAEKDFGTGGRSMVEAVR